MLNFRRKTAPTAARGASRAGDTPSVPDTARTGREGEEAAACFLAKLGWAILARNWRSGPLELDLVCREDDTLVFVEVKTRAEDGRATPAEAFTPAKRDRVIRAARAWLAAYDAWDRPCRFDLAAVTVRNGHYHTELMRHVMELDAGNRRPGHPVGRGHAAWQPW